MARRLRLDHRLQARFDASEVVQTALERAWADLRNFNGQTEAELLGWLREILNNAFLDAVRRENAGWRTPEAEEAVRDSSRRLDRVLGDPRPSPSEQVIGQEAWLRFAAAVERLPPGQRDVVLLRTLYDMPIKEIAAMVSESESAVAGLLERGRKALRRDFPSHSTGGEHV